MAAATYGAFTKIGFSKANMVRFSVDYDDGTEHVSIPDIATAFRRWRDAPGAAA